MNPRSLERYTIPGPSGKLEVALNTPAGAVAGIALIAHPNPVEGGTLDNKVVHTLARTFFALSYLTARFNYRGVGESGGSFDAGRGEVDDARAVLAHVREKAGDLPLVLAGFSFGAFVVSQLAPSQAVQRMVLVGPAVGRFAVGSVAANTIVVHGEQDDVVPLSDVMDWARPQELPIVVFPGCGHFFHGRLPQLSRVVTSLMRE